MSRPSGRPPKPTELKILQGNPGKRPLGSRVRGEIPSDVPEVPEHLGPAGRAAWALYWNTGRPWLAMSDVPILTQLCEAHDEADGIASVIRSEGLTHVSDKTDRSFVHHLYNDLRGLRREMRELWSLCYMTPTDRARANVKPDVQSPFSEWKAKREARTS